MMTRFWVWALVVTASLQLGSHAVTGGGSGGLKLELGATFPEVHVGEPIVLRVSLINQGDSTASVVARFEPSWGLVDIEITGEDGEGFWLQQRVLHSIDWIRIRKFDDLIAPNDSLYGFLTLLYCRQRSRVPHPLVIREPGSYRLSATYRLGSMRLHSNEVEITVRDTPPEQVAAREVFLSSDTVMFIATNMDSRPPGAATAYSHLVTTWPHSIYAGYAWFYLGRIDYAEKRYEEALEKYQRVLAEYDGCPYSELAEIGLAECRVFGRGEDLGVLDELPEGYSRNTHLYRLLQRLRLQAEAGQ